MHLIADLEFECIRDAILPVTLETVSKYDHVGDIKRSILTVKEGILGTVK